MPRTPNPMRIEGRAAQAQGLSRFVPTIGGCEKHPNSKHYSTSGRCCECAKLAKDPEKQAAYWAANKEKINAKRKQA